MTRRMGTTVGMAGGSLADLLAGGSSAPAISCTARLVWVGQ